jgi:hypothetical protein
VGAERWIYEIREHFGDTRNGGFFFAAADTPDLIVRNKTANDNPTPSGNGVTVEVLGRLWLLTGKETYRVLAQNVVNAFSGEIGRNFFPLSTLLNAAELLYDPIQVVIISPSDDGRELTRSVISAAPPNRVLQCIRPDSELPEGHPARGKTQLDGRPTAYICQGQSCSLPIADPASITDAFAKG